MKKLIKYWSLIWIIFGILLGSVGLITWIFSIPIMNGQNPYFNWIFTGFILAILYVLIFKINEA